MSTVTLLVDVLHLGLSFLFPATNRRVCYRLVECVPTSLFSSSCRTPAGCSSILHDTRLYCTKQYYLIMSCVLLAHFPQHRRPSGIDSPSQHDYPITPRHSPYLSGELRRPLLGLCITYFCTGMGRCGRRGYRGVFCRVIEGSRRSDSVSIASEAASPTPAKDLTIRRPHARQLFL